MVRILLRLITLHFTVLLANFSIKIELTLQYSYRKISELSCAADLRKQIDINTSTLYRKWTLQSGRSRFFAKLFNQEFTLPLQILQYCGI